MEPTDYSCLHLEKSIRNTSTFEESSLFYCVQKAHLLSGVPNGPAFAADGPLTDAAVVERRRRRKDGEAAVVHEQVLVRVLVLPGVNVTILKIFRPKKKPN
jgi:hypothetical protein